MKRNEFHITAEVRYGISIYGGPVIFNADPYYISDTIICEAESPKEVESQIEEGKFNETFSEIVAQGDAQTSAQDVVIDNISKVNVEKTTPAEE